MSEDVGRADDLAFRELELFIPPAGREGEWNTEKRSKNFTPIYHNHFLATKRHKSTNIAVSVLISPEISFVLFVPFCG